MINFGLTTSNRVIIRSNWFEISIYQIKGKSLISDSPHHLSSIGISPEFRIVIHIGITIYQNAFLALIVINYSEIKTLFRFQNSDSKMFHTWNRTNQPIDFI